MGADTSIVGQPELEESVPVAVERTADIAHVFLYGPVSIADLEDAATALDRQAPGLPRLVDTSQVTEVDLNFEALRRFSARRNGLNPDRGARTAIVADANLTFVYARIFQGLRRRPNVVVQVFRRGTDALAWLASEA